MKNKQRAIQAEVAGRDKKSSTITWVWQGLKGRHMSGKALQCKKGKASGLSWLEVFGVGKLEMA